MKLQMHSQLTRSFNLLLCSYLLPVKKKAAKRKAVVVRTVWVDSAAAAITRCLLVPSKSSCSKLVLCWDRVPPLSTTASSSFLCRNRHVKMKRFISWINERFALTKQLKTLKLLQFPYASQKRYEVFVDLVFLCSQGHREQTHYPPLNSTVALETNYMSFYSQGTSFMTVQTKCLFSWEHYVSHLQIKLLFY